MLQIKTYLDLQPHEQRVLFDHLKTSTLFTYELEMHVYFTSKSFNGGIECLTFWSDIHLLACLATATMYIPIKGDAYIPFYWISTHCNHSDADFILNKAISYCSVYSPKQLHLLDQTSKSPQRNGAEIISAHHFTPSNEVWTLIHRDPVHLMLQLDVTDTTFQSTRLPLFLPLKEHDVPEFLNIYNRVFHAQPLVWPLEAHDMKQRLDASLLSMNEKVVGISEAYISEDIGWIETIAVILEERGRGYGRALLHGCVKKLLAAGASEIRLQVLKNNYHAIELYQKVGFESLKCNGIWYSQLFQPQISEKKKSRRIGRIRGHRR